MAKNKNARKHTKLLTARHTGRIRPHKHTSYGSLFFILMLAFVPIAFISRSVNADNPPPVSGDYPVYAVVPAPVPKTAPQITNIASGKVYTTPDPITIAGTCPSSTMVKVFKNEVMGGAALCQNGAFQMQMDLFQGSNALIARAYNANDIPAPDSNPIAVSLQIPGVYPGTSATSQFSQFYLTSDVYYRGIEAGSSISWPITIAGGLPPYAVSVGWGDGKTDLISQGAPGKFTITHAYSTPAPEESYTIFINATDSNGSKTYLQLFAIVNGGKAAALTSGSSSGSNHKTIITVTTAVQVISIALLIVLSFWIGERRELAIIKHRAETAV